MNKHVTNHSNILLVIFSFEDLFTHCQWFHSHKEITGNDERAVLKFLDDCQSFKSKSKSGRVYATLQKLIELNPIMSD